MAGTVKVRIAVAVAPDGGWLAHGAPDADEYDHATETSFTPGDRMYFVTAELEIPDEAPAVEASGLIEVAA